MPGFAVTSSISASEGKALATYTSNVGTTATNLLTAIKKTRITSVVAANKSGGILPISLIVVKVGGAEVTVIKNSRVFKMKHLLLSLIAEDSRVSADKMADIPHTEIVLLAGESLRAISPLDDSFDVTVTYSEGIS